MTINKNEFYYKNNKLRQLQGFMSVVKHCSITKAAKELGLTPPAITQQIQSLEKQLKVKLFTKNFELTTEGLQFYNKSFEKLSAIENLYEDFIIQNLSKKENHIRIAGDCLILQYIMKYLTKLNKNIHFVVFNLDKDEALKKLINNEVDIIFYDLSTQKITGLEVKTFINEPYCLMLPHDHKMLKLKEISIKDLQKSNLIRTSKDESVREIEKIKYQDVFMNRMHIINANYDIIKSAIVNNLGIAIYPKLFIDTNFIAKDISNLVGFYKIDIGISTTVQQKKAVLNLRDLLNNLKND